MDQVNSIVDLPEEERKLLNRLFNKLGTYPPRVLAVTLSQIERLGLVKLDGNGYGEEVCFIADMLRDHKGFSNVDLSNNRIPPKGAASLADAMKNHKVLEVMKFDRNPFGDEGIAHIAEALKVNKSLRSLSVMDCSFTVVGVRSLVMALKENKTLMTIHLSGNIIGDDGAAALAQLLMENRTLQYISLDDCKISDNGAQSILKAMQVNKSVIVYCTRFNQILDAKLISSLENLVKGRREIFLKHDKERKKMDTSQIKQQQRKLNEMQAEMSTKMKKIGEKEEEIKNEKNKLETEFTKLSEEKKGGGGGGGGFTFGRGKRFSKRQKAPNEVWCMLVGSDGCGESELLHTFSMVVPGANSGDGLEKFVTADINSGKHDVRLSLHHYSGESKMSRARYLGLMSADIVIFLFSLHDSLTFQDVAEEFSADAIYSNTRKEKESPFYMVGYDADKRANPLGKFDVDSEHAKALATKVGAKAYYEIGTANRQEQFKILLDLIMKDALKIKK